VTDCIDELLALADEHGALQSQVVGKLFRGWAKTFTGDTARGVAELRASIAEIRTAQVAGLVGLLCLAAEGCAQVDDRASALRFLDEAWDLSLDTGEHLNAAEIPRLKGRLTLLDADADPEEAESNFVSAVDIARQQGAKSLNCGLSWIS
jgi:predicted ATPase